MQALRANLGDIARPENILPPRAKGKNLPQRESLLGPRGRTEILLFPARILIRFQVRSHLGWTEIPKSQLFGPEDRVNANLCYS